MNKYYTAGLMKGFRCSTAKVLSIAGHVGIVTTLAHDLLRKQPPGSPCACKNTQNIGKHTKAAPAPDLKATPDYPRGLGYSLRLSRAETRVGPAAFILFLVHAGQRCPEVWDQLWGYGGRVAGWQGVRLSGLGPVVGPVLKWQGLGLEALSLLDIVWP